MYKTHGNKSNPDLSMGRNIEQDTEIQKLSEAERYREMYQWEESLIFLKSLPDTELLYCEKWISCFIPMVIWEEFIQGNHFLQSVCTQYHVAGSTINIGGASCHLFNQTSLIFNGLY